MRHDILRTVLRRALTALIVAGGLVCPAPGTLAAPARLAGTWAGTVELGPVLLDGNYPFIFGEASPGRLDVTTSPTGALDGRVTFAAQTEDAVGQIVVTRSKVELKLQGKIDQGRLRVAAKLRGSAFVGTVTFRGKSTTCRIEVGATAPLVAKYECTLATSRTGAVSGKGTLTTGRKVLPVTVRGSAKKSRVDLTVTGKRTQLKFTRGALNGTSITARKWNAVGFGATASAGPALQLVAK